MTTLRIEQQNEPDVTIELRDPLWAAFFAWLWPGAGHIYQRRYAKGILFMICILGTFIFGFGLGRGRVVYASMKKNDVRWQYFLQLGNGLPALPALLQAYKTKNDGTPFFKLASRYPEGYRDENRERLDFQIIEDMDSFDTSQGKPLIDGLYAPPPGPSYLQNNDVLGMWHFESKQNFDTATLFVMIAGLLNLLAIYDAFAGPFILTPEELEHRKKKKKRRDPRNDE